jgi:O-acetylserine/cysteine efflux transporter
VVPFVLIAPPVAMVSAWALLGEVPNLAESAGGVVVLAGVLVTTRRSRPASHQAQRPVGAAAHVADVHEPSVLELLSETDPEVRALACLRTGVVAAE